MNEIINYFIGYGLPVILLVVLLLTLIMAMGVAISWFKYLVYGYLLIVFLAVSPNTFGTLDGSGGFATYFWVKGTKSFFFSFLDMILFGTWLLGVVVLSFWAKSDERLKNPLSKWYLTFGGLFLGYVFFAMFEKTPLLLQFSSRGVINVLWQGMFVSLLFATLRTEKEIKTLTWIIVCCLASREAFGLFRYAFMGGDPQNYYANFQHLNVKMTFWDINDSILGAVMMGFATWKLLVESIEKWEHKFGYGLLAIMGLLTPVLTSRRTAQSGVFLALALLFFLLPRGRRTPILIVLALIIPLAVGSLALRSIDSKASLLEKVLLDVKTDKNADPRLDRYYELRVAWQTVREEPFFGVGLNGSFKVSSPVGLYYHGGVYDYVHSGFGHILLKTGFVGLFIFLGIFVTYIWQVIIGWKFVLVEHKALVVGVLCGFVTQLPNMISGAPISEIRTMQLSGFLFAVPLICIAIGRKKLAEKQSGSASSENNYKHFSPTLPMSIDKKYNK